MKKTQRRFAARGVTQASAESGCLSGTLCELLYCLRDPIPEGVIHLIGRLRNGTQLSDQKLAVSTSGFGGIYPMLSRRFLVRSDSALFPGTDLLLADRRNHRSSSTLIRNALFPSGRTVPLARISAHSSSRQSATLKHPSKTNPQKPANDWLMSLLNCSRFAMKHMSLAEILEELPKLTEEERDELRSRLDEYDPGFLAVLQERASGIESGERETIPVDQVIAEGRRLAQELAQQ
jgi:hypothetical protein